MLDGMVAKARAAAEIIATYDQERVDRLCQAVAASVIDMKVWANLADEAVDETGLGDKVTKRNKRNKLKLILRDCLRQKSVGVIEEIPEKGIVKYAKPVGVIASLVPTTNPCLTPAGQVIYAIKARDVIICSPHPRAKKTTNKCINIIRETLVREGAPADIIQGIEEPSITPDPGADEALRPGHRHRRSSHGQVRILLRCAGLRLRRRQRDCHHRQHLQHPRASG